MLVAHAGTGAGQKSFSDALGRRVSIGYRARAREVAAQRFVAQATTRISAEDLLQVVRHLPNLATSEERKVLAVFMLQLKMRD